MIDATMEKSLLLLPDDALLAVLAFLRPRRLMALRVLCRRLRDVCLHPDLWRRVSLSSTRQRGLLLAALRLAPCLRSLTIQSVDPVLADGLLNTRCAIAKLHMPVEVAVEASEAWAETVVQHLHSAGGVSSLSVSLRGTPVENASPLLRVICGMDGLAELSIFIDNNETLSVPVDCPVPKPSLTLLHYAPRAMDPFLAMLLEAHRSTLQTVLVATTSFPGSDSPPKLVPFPADLFNAMPQLRKLCCPPDEALSQLQALPLDGVFLAVGFDRQPFPQVALEFLRQASRLRSVELRLSQVDPATPVQALGQARSAGLIKQLSLKFGPGHLDEVAAVWPRLPSLRTLSMDAKPTDSFLRALSPASVPSLTSLVVPCFEPCAHEWLHSPAVQDVLVRNQQLHLRIPVTAGATEDCRCWWCVKGCHSELTPHSPIVCSSFSAHSKAPGCPDTCFQIAVPLCPRCEPRN